MLALRELLPRTDLSLVVVESPALLLSVVFADHNAPFLGLKALVTSSLAELSFLPSPVVDVLLQEEPWLLSGVPLGRLEALREAWESKNLDDDELAELVASTRFGSWVRNYLCDHR